ncbi:MAG: hypothetical protein IPF61_11040 [Xanthomonadales bacterium]|nr:hypothetical protein [Xanthomonadales bacterium]
MIHLHCSTFDGNATATVAGVVGKDSTARLAGTVVEHGIVPQPDTATIVARAIVLNLQ